MSSAREIQTNTRPKGWLILLPGILLAGWGGWQVWRGSLAAEVESRRQVHAALELVREKVTALLRGAPPGWRADLLRVRVADGELHSPLLFPEIPEPQPDSVAQRLFAAGKFAEVYGEHPGELSASGLPLSVLAAEGLMRTATTTEQKLHWARMVREEALNNAPSPISPVALGNVLRHFTEQRITCPEDLRWMGRAWDSRSSLRRLLATRAADLRRIERPVVFETGEGWLVWRAENELRVWPAGSLRDSIARLVYDAQLRDVPRWLGFRVLTEDRFALFPSEGAPKQTEPEAVTARTGGLIIEAVIRSPAMMRREQRTGLILQISLLTAALAVSVLAWIHMRRAWRRQADLAAQKDNFLACVSHELRTPLASVRTLTENLAAGTVSEEPARQHYYAVMLQEMQRLSGLVENVLDFARISQDRKHYHFAPCHPAELVEEALRPMHPLAAKRGITLAETVEPLPQTPLADAPAMQQSLINLVDNALKFSPPESTVRVLVRAHGDGWELCVEDEGPGIPPGEEERIFERFYRAGSELRRETPGAGIGLSLVRHTAQGHGGTAFATNRPEGGARTGLRLPFFPPALPRP